MPNNPFKKTNKKKSSFAPKQIVSMDKIYVHSNYVHRLKMILPITAGLLLSFMLIWPKFMREQTSLISSAVPKIAINSNEAMTIINPSFQSHDKNSNPFNLSALKAVEKTKSIVILDEPKGDIFRNSTDLIAFTAKSGEYNRENQHLSFFGDASIFSDKGYSLHTERVNINVKTKDVDSNTAVVIESDSGNITGKGFKIINMGKTLIIKGKAKMVIKDGKYAF